MGTWGVGNVDSDDAEDFLYYTVFEPLKSQIRSVLTNDASSDADGDGLATIVAVDTLATLCGHFNKTSGIEKNQLQAIRSRYLEVWGVSMDALGATSPVTFKADRQAMIEMTFERLLEHCD